MPLWAVATCFDVASVALFILAEVKNRLNEARLKEIRQYIARIEISTTAIETMSFPEGATRDGVALDEATRIAVDGAKMAIANNKEQLMKLEDEIERSNRFAFVLLALACLFIGTILHGVNEYRQHLHPGSEPTAGTWATRPELSFDPSPSPV